jgi:3-oxosteroid 1-dehydrogenase
MFDGKLLGPELAHLNPPTCRRPPGLTVFSADYKWLNLRWST